MPSENTKAPRPPNSWILYRAHALKNMPPVQPGEPRRNQGDVSQLVARMWREAPDTVRAEFERLAEEAKALHKIQFPNYRYQPRKKEDKERVKEMAKQQKESQRQAKRTRRVGQTPALSPSPAISRPAPYYVPNMRYGPGGPTPPLSAASSPAGDDVASPRLRFLSAEPQVVASSTSSPLVSPVVLPTTKIEPPAIQLPFPLSPPTPSTDTTLDNQPSQWRFSAGESQPSSELSSAGWDSSSIGVADGNQMSSLVFDIPEPAFNNASWLSGDLAFLSDPNQIFHLPDFDPSALSFNPTTELEISVGTQPLVQDTPAYLDTNFFQNPLDVQSTPVDFSSFVPFSTDFSYLDYNTFSDGQYSTTEAGSSAFSNLLPPLPPATDDPVAADESPAPSSSYIPPAGAAYSSTRRVGGSWANYTRERLVAPSA